MSLNNDGRILILEGEIADLEDRQLYLTANPNRTPLELSLLPEKLSERRQTNLVFLANAPAHQDISRLAEELSRKRKRIDQPNSFRMGM